MKIYRNYPSEISAFAHRIGNPHLESEKIVKALTMNTFFSNNERNLNIIGESPLEESTQIDTDINSDLIEKGRELMEYTTLAFVRCHCPFAPEEFICNVVARFLSDESLCKLATSLSLHNLVRTDESPPSEETLCNSIYALIGVLAPEKIPQFVIQFILPQFLDLALEDVLPFRNPLPILVDYLKAWKDPNIVVEPRLMHSNGTETSIPLYVVGIYANKELIGECNLYIIFNSFILAPGEKLSIAVDLAAQDALLKLWKISNQTKVFPFGNLEYYQANFANAQKSNHSLMEICDKSTDLSLLSNDELEMDPIDVVEMMKDYKEKIYPHVGIPHRKKLRHFFSRGTLAKNTRRALVKPVPYRL